MVNEPIIETNEMPKPVSWLHLFLLVIPGVVSVFSPLAVTALWAAVGLLTVYSLINRKIEWVWYGIVASPMLEVWGRMSKAPMVPYEAGKYYLLVSLVVLLIHHIKHKTEYPAHRPGLPILLLLLPGSVVAIAGFDREQWVFNLLPTLELGALLLLAARERWTIDEFCKTLRFGLLPIIPMLIYLTLRSPSFSELSFTLSANAEAAGGFGSNQVSTVLGNAIVLTFVLMALKYPLFPFRWLSFVLLGYLALRGLLTFSRGGMLSALFSIAVAIIPLMFSSLRSFLKSSVLILGLTIVGFGVFSIINTVTGNKLSQRYSGETEGTLSGKREKTLNLITSGRVDIALADFEIFKKNIIFGVGPGGAKDLRGDYGAIENSAAHTEFSRLLSEHGIGGLVVALTILVFPFLWVRKQKFGQWRMALRALFTLAIFTAMHSAMRTNTTIVYYVLAAMPVVMNDYWYRKFKMAD